MKNNKPPTPEQLDYLAEYGIYSFEWDGAFTYKEAQRRVDHIKAGVAAMEQEEKQRLDAQWKDLVQWKDIRSLKSYQKRSKSVIAKIGPNGRIY